MSKRKYHGWIVVEEPAPGYNPPVHVEWTDNGGPRKRLPQGYANSGCAQAIEWWDNKVGEPVMLEAIIKGCYRVYTMEEE